MSQEIAKTAVFKGNHVRRALVDDQWWFSVIDVVAILSESGNPRDYWYKMKIREKDEAGVELSTNCRQLKLTAPDGKMRETDCADTEGIFRIIQSIPSPKAEPFKRWLARIGKERLDEIENPELGMQRTKELYEKRGYPKGWIEKRLRGIAVRQKLTDEWNGRGAKTDRDYAILTNEILQGAFDFKVDDYKKHKGLTREHLRDHMTDLELIITMLGEAATTRITEDRDSQGIPALQKDARDGGAVAGRTRKDIEQQTGTRIVSKENFLPNKAKKPLKQK
ncbi:MAG: Bro-N domain-containing protein [Candidatus Omnitrophica bacterium]|nr:Bro-N domain-containing protein [Candidatus Omnitrophota bacterium]